MSRLAKAGKKTKKPAAPRRGDNLDVLIATINKELGSGGRVLRGADIDYLTWERVTTGSLGLDIITGGGLPRAGVTQFKGEESTAKTTMALHTCAESQRVGGRVAWGAVEGFDKAWARTNGCFIPYSDKEVYQLAKKHGTMGKAKEFAQEYAGRHEGWGDFILVQMRSSPALLESMSRLIRSGSLDIAVVDSLGALISEEDDDKDIGDDVRVGGNSKIIAHFVNKVRKSFNSQLEDGTPNKTCVIAINQVRDQIGVYSPRGKPPPEAGGGYSLKHGKDIDVRFTRGELMQASVSGRKVVYGREVKAKCEKNKTAPPFRQASWSLYFRDFEDKGGLVKAGTVDMAHEVATWSVYYGAIQQAGAWYHAEQQRFQGFDNLVSWLRENPELVRDYREAVLELARHD